jgi:DNA-binding transcriptional regulator LsrR (DeoR family)
MFVPETLMTPLEELSEAYAAAKVDPAFQAELDDLLQKGAVGDIALRYFDAEGRGVGSEINDRIIGITLEQLKRGPKVVAASGGPEKVPAIRAALRGGLIDVLVTDSVTAGRLLEPSDG